MLMNISILHRFLLFKVIISPEKIILRREKEDCAIFIRAYFKSEVEFTVRVGAKLKS